MASTSASTGSNIVQLRIDNNLSVDDLISRIDDFLAQKSSSRNKSKGHTFSDVVQPLSADLSKLLEGISQGAKMISDQKKMLSNLSSEAQKTAVSVLQELGNAHVAAAGFLVIASVLERLERVSFNKKECLVLLNKMTDLAKCIRLLKAKSGLDNELQKKTEDAFQFIVQGAIMCSTQIGLRKFYKFLLASKNKEDLLQLDKDIEHLYDDLNLDTTIATAPSRPTELPYPSHGIGIDHQVKAVTEYLDCQGDMVAVVVVVYGVGGFGKTTITDGVFASLIKVLEAGYRTSSIKLHEDVHLSTKIEELQAQILHDLTGQRHDISHYKIGQYEINKCLKKGPVLLYVDNVLRRQDIEQILPKQLDNPKKFRLLLTARKRDVGEIVESCGIDSCKYYEIEPLEIEASLELLHRKIGVSRDHVVPKIGQIAEKCSGIPLVLEVVGGYLKRRRDNMEAEAIGKSTPRSGKGEPFSGNRQDMGYEAKLLFVYDDLTQDAQDAFLDICMFFHGWNWEKVASIVGEEEWRTLLEGALVKTIADETNVHDVLVGIGRKKAKASESQAEMNCLLLYWCKGRVLYFSSSLPNSLTNSVHYITCDASVVDVSQSPDRIKGIWLAGNRVPVQYSEMSVEMLDQMHQSLRVLALGDWTVVSGTCNNTFHSLRFLQVGDVPCLPFNIARLNRLKYFDNGSGRHISMNTPSQASTFFFILPLHANFIKLDSTTARGTRNMVQDIFFSRCCLTFLKRQCLYSHENALPYEGEDLVNF